MMQAPRGNTQKNVNQEIANFLFSQYKSNSSMRMLDVPCGEAEFLSFVKSQRPQFDLVGVDKFAESRVPGITTHKMGAHDFFQISTNEKFDVITCISGIMCFDGIDDLLFNFSRKVALDGYVIVTNDNMMTIRDRLQFLFFGHFKRFGLLPTANEGNWNVVLPQFLSLKLEKYGFKIENVRFVSIYTEDWLLLPLVVIFYPIFLLPIFFKKNHWSLAQRLKLFSWKSLIARHYIVFAKRTNKDKAN